MRFILPKIAAAQIFTLCTILWLATLPVALFAQAPANDDCSNAIIIPIPAGGFGTGSFAAPQTDMSNATVQPGENYAPALFVAGLDKKSAWYKFSIPTNRAVRVTLSQPGIAITAGDAGFTVYQANACLPGSINISNKLTPIVTFGNTYHPCVPPGDYLVQVSSTLGANGPVNLSIEIADPAGAYDHQVQAGDFGVIYNYAHAMDFDTECQSIDDAAEVCSGIGNAADYNKTAWFTFTTPPYFDYIILTLSGTGTPLYFLNGGAGMLKTFGYNIYKGNVHSTPYNTLPLLNGCDSLQTDGRTAGTKKYNCNDLLPNTTYSIQLFVQKDFKEILRLGLLTGGTAATAAPLPVTAMPSSNRLGILPASPGGTGKLMYDYFGCNSRHSVIACDPAIPAAGIDIGGVNYSLSSFATFTLQQAAAIRFRTSMTICGPSPLVRIFKQSTTSNCADLDPANIVATATYNTTVECLAPGDYVLQVLGTEKPLPASAFTYISPVNNIDQCFFGNLGARYQMEMMVYTRQTNSHYTLKAFGEFDSINLVGAVQQPLVSGVDYLSSPDTIGCTSTLRPWDTTCYPLNDKVIYRQFNVADSGTVGFSTMLYSINTTLRYRLYAGDANALATAQGVYLFPDRVNNIVPQSLCIDGYATLCNNKTVCVLPGTYTFATMASNADVGKADRPTITFEKTRTKHNSPFTAQDFGNIIDTLGPNGGVKISDADYWSCEDNAVPINGFVPCTWGGSPATKAIYRQFYLKEDAVVKIANTVYPGCYGYAYGYKTLFYGKATDGLAGLSAVGYPWTCFNNAQTANNCTPLTAGWYTVVSYGTGPNYDDPLSLLNIGGRYNSHVSYMDEFELTIVPTCKGPQFNRPYKASVDAGNQPHLIQWADRAGGTTAYPRTDTTYSLPAEYFNCTLDTPFANHPIRACDPAANRVAYWVFKTTQVSFLQINTGSFVSALYDKDVRTDSLQFANAVPIQQCGNMPGFVQFCSFQPGTYTLVLFAKDINSCSKIAPQIYIDKIGYSRFDYAANAYDFGVVQADSVYYNGKQGDVNPLNASRAPSNDFFYCTTGAFSTDPVNAVCYALINPAVYNPGFNKPMYDSAFPATGDIARRNLWYTFVAANPGTVKVKVEAKTNGRLLQPKFAVFRSDVDASLPFSTVVANGEVDSTNGQGLSFVASNPLFYPFHCFNTLNNISFYRDPCGSAPSRYYVLVENVNANPVEPGGQLPNTQVEVSVLIDSLGQASTKFDHHYQASDFGNVGPGIHRGATDSYACASRDATDPVFNGYPTCLKTLWYKFSTNITGNVRYRIVVNAVNRYTADHVQLLKEAIPGDSTINGLKIQPFANVSGTGGLWAQSCVAPGTYYLLLTGCGRVDEFEYPQIELIEAEGDFCSRAVPASIAGPGSVTASLLVNCHTIGTDYGEFGSQLTCPPNANTAEYKSSWFRMDIGGTDTLDVTTFLQENTNAASSDIKYRLMTGDCGAMQEQSCVLDALTQNTYQCLVPGQSYFVQVFTPIVKNTVAVTGSIILQLNAVVHADTCSPPVNCLASANFLTQFDCNRDDSVKFLNFSTYGTNINYQWDFGYNGQSSSGVAPSFFYPALPADETYTVKLTVTNNSCGKKDSVTRTVTIPGRPYVNLGADIVECSSSAAPVKLRATSQAGATYLWQNNSTADTLVVTASGNKNYWVTVNYNGCSSSDSIRILRSPITARPLQQLTLCTDSVLVDVRRGLGETYRWNTGATTRSIYVSAPGFYWADISYFDCVHRDSFEVSKVTAALPLGNDSTACLSNGGFVLHAKTPGATAYLWQNNSTADSISVTAPGEYRVNISFGNCTLKDTVNMLGYPAPLFEAIDTSICSGNSLLLPWGVLVSATGTYRDTVDFPGGCDSLIRRVDISIKANPHIGNDTVFCSLQNGFVLNATTAGGLSYTWQDGDTNAVYTVTVPGSYIVQVNVGSCVAADTIDIRLQPPPVKRILKDTSICDGAGIQLPWGLLVQQAGTYGDTLQSSGGCDSMINLYVIHLNARPALGLDRAASTCSGVPLDLTSYFNTASLNAAWSINNAPVADPSAVNVPGSYRLIVTNANGCTDTASLAVTVSSKPFLGNDTSFSICSGNSFNLENVYTTTGLSSNWTLNNLLVSAASAVTAAGNYRLIATSSAGCADTATVSISVILKPNLVVHDPATVCLPNTVDLTASTITAGSTPGLSLTYWRDSLASTVYSNAAIATDGLYYIKAIMPSGCFSIQPVLVTRYAVPQVNAGDDIGICDKDSVATLSVTVTNTTVAVTYNWQPVFQGITDSSSASTVVKPLTMPVQYFVTVTDGYGCNYTVTDTVVVSKQPPVMAFAGNDTIASTGIPHQLNATGGVGFTWSQQNLLDNPFIANPLATIYADSVSFAVEVKDAAGCTGYDTVKVKTYNGITYYLPNAFSPNGDGRNDVFRPLPVGIVSTEWFRIFNRYGELIFETSQWMKGWDGSYKGKPQPAANYIWIIKGRGRNEKTIEMKGNVVLVR